MRAADRPGSGVRRLPMSHVDHLWLNATTVAATGPLEVPPREELVAAFVAHAAAGPDSRIGLRFDPSSSRHWLYRTDDLEAYADASVVQLEPGADDDLDALMTRIAAEAPRDRPVRLFRSDRHLITMLSHAVGDSRFVINVPLALLTHCRTGEVAPWAGAQVDPNPLRTAVQHTFDKPERVVRLLRSRRRMSIGRSALPSDGPATEAFVPQPVVVNESGSANATRELKTWTKQHAPGAAHFATVLAAVSQALIEAGIPVSPQLHMVYDLRRYLPKGHVTNGNFVAGIDIPARLDDPVAVTQAVSDAATTGHPLAAQMLGVAMSAVQRNRTETGQQVPRHPSARLALSYVGVKPVDNALPWTGPLDERTYWCRVDPAGPTGITLLVAVIGRRLRLSASFHASVFDPATVRAALRASHDDQLGLLDRAVGAARTHRAPSSR